MTVLLKPEKHGFINNPGLLPENTEFPCLLSPCFRLNTRKHGFTRFSGINHCLKPAVIQPFYEISVFSQKITKIRVFHHFLVIERTETARVVMSDW